MKKNWKWSDEGIEGSWQTNFLLLIFFFCCLICVDFFFFLLSFVFLFVWFFLLYFALFFVGFGGLGLPCHLLCCYCYLFIYLFYLFFFYLHGFSGFIFCKFNCSWHFFTSSDRVPPGGLVAREPRFGDWYRGVVSYTNDDWESEWADYDELMDMVPRKRLTMGWEDDAWARGGVRLLLPPGWSWLDDPADGVNCFVFFFFFVVFFIFWKSMGIDGWLKVSYSELSVTLRDLFCLLQGAVKTPRLGGKFHSAFRNIIPVTTPIELRRLLILPRRKEMGETSPEILLNCWVGVVLILYDIQDIHLYTCYI